MVKINPLTNFGGNQGDVIKKSSIYEFLSNSDIRYIDLRILSKDIQQSVSNNIYGNFEFPFNCIIISVGAYVDVAGTTGVAIYNINKNGASIMGNNKINIESGAISSRTSATQPTLTTTNIAEGDIITFDIDAVHSTPAKGLVIRFLVKAL